VNNKPDVLARVAGTLGGRGYNIDTLCVDATLDPKISKIILSVYQDQSAITKIEKQLLRLIDVHSVSELTETETVMREMMLVRMKLTEKNKADIALIIDTFRGRVVTMNGDSCVSRSRVQKRISKGQSRASNRWGSTTWPGRASLPWRE